MVIAKYILIKLSFYGLTTQHANYQHAPIILFCLVFNIKVLSLTKHVVHGLPSHWITTWKHLQITGVQQEQKCEFHILQMLLFIPNINACIPQDRPSATCATNSIHKCAYLLCTITNCKRHDGKAEENITFFEVCKWILVRQKGLINIYQGSRVTQFLCTTCVCQYCSLFGWPWRGGDARVIAEVCVGVFRVPILNFLA